MCDFKWYVVHTYSGIENKAKKSLQERVKQYSMEDKFGEILVPIERVEEIKSGTRKESVRKCFPGYILVQMKLDDGTFNLVKNTPKITGFVGGARPPLSLKEHEVEKLRNMEVSGVRSKISAEYIVGDSVRVIEGPFDNFSGTVDEVKLDKRKVRVLVSIFGRSTPIELDYLQVEKIN